MFLIHLHVNHPNAVLQEPLCSPKAPGACFLSPQKPFFLETGSISCQMQTNLNPQRFGISWKFSPPKIQKSPRFDWNLELGIPPQAWAGEFKMLVVPKARGWGQGGLCVVPARHPSTILPKDLFNQAGGRSRHPYSRQDFLSQWQKKQASCVPGIQGQSPA